MKAKNETITKIVVYLLCGFMAVNIIFTLIHSLRQGGVLGGSLSFFFGWTLALVIGTMLLKENYRKLLVGVLFILACISGGFFLFSIVSPSAFSLNTVSARQAMFQTIFHGVRVIFYISAAYLLSRESVKKLFRSSTN